MHSCVYVKAMICFQHRSRVKAKEAIYSEALQMRNTACWNLFVNRMLSRCINVNPC